MKARLQEIEKSTANKPKVNAAVMFMFAAVMFMFMVRNQLLINQRSSKIERDRETIIYSKNHYL